MPREQRVFRILVWVIAVAATVALPGVALQFGAPWPLLSTIYLFLMAVGSLVTLAILAGYGG